MAHTNEAAKKAYEEINTRMHHAMMGDMTGDPDRDFVEGMIPHHQGAIEMARVVIEHGDDAELKKLAGEIIAAQEREVAFLEDWKRRHRA
jgi:uncharacterized protein (DUF305 family)